MGIIKKLYQNNSIVEITTGTESDAVYPITSDAAVYHSAGWGTKGTNQTVDSILQSLNEGYQYVGLATPSTSPGVFDHKVFYIAGESGTYSYFGGITVSGLTILRNNGNSWIADAVGITGSGSGGSIVGVTGYIGSTAVQQSAEEQDLYGIGDIHIGSGKKIYFGGTNDVYIEYTSSGFHFSKSLYSDLQVVAGGTGSGGSGGGGGGGGDSVSITNVDNTNHLADLTVNSSTVRICLNGYAAGGGGGGISTETDPVFTASPAYGISASDISNWRNLTSNVQADWSQTNQSAPSYIKNKPTIPSAVTESTVSGWGFTKNAGTVTSVTLTSGTGITVSDSGTAITSFGSRTISLSSEWQTKINNGNSAYGSLSGYVPTSRTINGYDLTQDRTLSKSDIGLSNVENTALSTWAGTSNITTVGTITTGTWSGNAISVTKGGTGLTGISKGEILYGSASNVISRLSANQSRVKKFLSEPANGIPSWVQLTLSDLPNLYIGATQVTSTSGTVLLKGITGICAETSPVTQLGSGVVSASLISWDSDNNAWHFSGNIYADGNISAGGTGSSGSGGGGSSVSWTDPSGSTTGWETIGTLTINGTANTIKAPQGTITQIKANNTIISSGGVADLGTVLTQHQIMGLVASSVNGTTNDITSNGNTYLNLIGGTSSREKKEGIKILGSRNVSVTSNSSGEVTIQGPDLTTYLLKSDFLFDIRCKDGIAGSEDMNYKFDPSVENYKGNFKYYAYVEKTGSNPNATAATHGFPTSNHANALLTIDTYKDASTLYLYQIGFSSDSKIYFRHGSSILSNDTWSDPFNGYGRWNKLLFEDYNGDANITQDLNIGRNIVLTKGNRIYLNTSSSAYLQQGGDGSDYNLYLNPGVDGNNNKANVIFEGAALLPNVNTCNIGADWLMWNNMYVKRWYPDATHYIEYYTSGNTGYFKVNGDLVVTGQVVAGQSA